MKDRILSILTDRGLAKGSDFVRHALKVYEDYIRLEEGDVKLRIGNIISIALIDSILRGGLLIIRLPTGYGKSTISYALASAVKEFGAEFGLRHVIHVLPLRSIVEDLLRKAQKGVEKRVGGLDEFDIGYQASIRLGQFKDELFQRTLVFTTLDSFTLNFAKITPLRSKYASYEIARSSIYTSIVIFDEAHLFAEVKEEKAYTTLTTVIKSLLEVGIPVIIMTATIPDSLIHKIILDSMPSNKTTCIVLTLDFAVKGEFELMDDSGKPYREIKFKDEEWRKTFENLKIDTYLEDKDISKIVKDIISLTSNLKSILIVRNTVVNAIKTYLEITESTNEDGEFRPCRFDETIRVYLLHGRLSECDRKNVLSKINEDLKNDRRVILVATQVIEAGVDLSFDVLITDAAPFAQIVQRVGRIARKGEKNGIVFVLKHIDDLIYDKGLVESSLEKIRQFGNSIKWRIPKTDDKSSYFAILEDVYKDYYRRLTINYEVRGTLEMIDKIVVVHRRDAERVLNDFCGSLVREVIQVPVIVGEMDGDCDFVNLDLEYLVKHERYREIIEMKDNRAYVVLEIEGLENIKELKDENVKEFKCGRMRYVVVDGFEIPKCKEGDRDLDECLLNWCKSLMILQRYTHKLKGLKTRLIGFKAKDGSYRHYIGFNVDVR